MFDFNGFFFFRRLSVDFAENENSDYKLSDNIILHLSARFNEKQIIRSSHFPNLGWSDEQISDNLIGKVLKNPMRPGIFQFILNAKKK